MANMSKPKPKPTSKATPKRAPGQMTPSLKKWLDTLTPYERKIAEIQIKGEKKAGKLSKGTM